MKLYMVRHGETECNVNRVYYGSLDVPITENGRRQAEAVGDMLCDVVFDKVIVSGLCRTRQTAEAILSRQTSSAEICQAPAFNEILVTGKGFTIQRSGKCIRQIIKPWGRTGFIARRREERLLSISVTG